MSDDHESEREYAERLEVKVTRLTRQVEALTAALDRIRYQAQSGLLVGDHRTALNVLGVIALTAETALTQTPEPV